MPSSLSETSGFQSLGGANVAQSTSVLTLPTMQGSALSTGSDSIGQFGDVTQQQGNPRIQHNMASSLPMVQHSGSANEHSAPMMHQDAPVTSANHVMQQSDLPTVLQFASGQDATSGVVIGQDVPSMHQASPSMHQASPSMQQPRGPMAPQPYFLSTEPLPESLIPAPVAAMAHSQPITDEDFPAES